MWSFFIATALLWACIYDLYFRKIPVLSMLLIMSSAQHPKTKPFFIIIFLYGFVLLFISFFDINLPMGTGDVLLFASLAFSIEGKSVFNIFCLSQLILSAYIAIMFFAEKIKKKKMLGTAYPLAPFILISYLILSASCG